MRIDFPPDIEDQRRKLYPVFRATMKDPNLKEGTVMFYDKVTINGTLYSVKDLYKLPASLQPEHLATNKDEHSLIFSESGFTTK